VEDYPRTIQEFEERFSTDWLTTRVEAQHRWKRSAAIPHGSLFELKQVTFSLVDFEMI